MSMGSKDYEMLASAFADAIKSNRGRATLSPGGAIYEASEIVARSIKRDYPRFNPQMFLDRIKELSK